MTPETLDRLAAAHKAATQGDWNLCGDFRIVKHPHTFATGEDMALIEEMHEALLELVALARIAIGVVDEIAAIKCDEYAVGMTDKGPQQLANDLRTRIKAAGT